MKETPFIQQDGKAATVKSTFSRQTAVTVNIHANPLIIWTLLTDASDYPRWNSTVISIQGNIAMGEKIKVRSTIDPKRSFNLKVKVFEPQKKLVWGDAMGERTYTLDKTDNRSTVVSMTERIGGPIFPFFAKMIPSFDQSFEQFVADLKKEAESIMAAK